MEEFKEVKIISDEIKLARNSEDEFYRILRKRCNWENTNYESFTDLVAYDGLNTPESFKAKVKFLKENYEERIKLKSDREDNKTIITDAPGYGAVRLNPPYEKPGFDVEYANFINSIIEPEDTVIDFGGGASPFLALLPECKEKILVEVKDFKNLMDEVGITYVHPDNFKGFPPKSIATCFHTLEHVSNPEELILKFSEADIFIFATPNKELIETSKYHYIYMEIDIFKRLSKKHNLITYLRTSAGPFKMNTTQGLDIHGIIFNKRASAKFSKVSQNNFFKNNFIFYRNLFT
jgi:hypothetical protein